MDPAVPSDDLWFRSADGAFEVRLGGEAVERMLMLCHRARRLETGGVLIGQYSSDHRVAYVEVATGPGSDSRAGSTWLLRGVRGLQNILDTFWSQKRGYYIGEWHFHPGAEPSPSRRDVAQMQSIASSELYHCPEPLLVVIGGDAGSAPSILVEVHTRRGQRISLHGGSTERHGTSNSIGPAVPPAGTSGASKADS